MNIGIFDTEHFETAYPLIRLMQLPGRRIFIFTNAHCQQRLSELLNGDEAQLNWVIQQPNESNRQFIHKLNTLIRQLNIQLLFYNTISNNHLLHALLLKNHPSLRTVLTVHDINDLTRYTPAFTPGGFYRNIGRRQLLKHSSELNVISETMMPYLRDKIGKHHIIHNIPGAIFETEPATLTVSGAVNLVIPGTIDKKRRDYLQALELLIEADSVKLPLNMTFLGSPYADYGKNILESARQLHLKYAKIHLYEAEVPQPEFDAVMKQSHFVFIPSVKKSYTSTGNWEIYGETKSSGGIFDAVRHGKPMIVPWFLNVPTAIERRCMRYKNVADLITLLKACYSHPDQYLAWQRNALESSRQFTVGMIRSANPSLFS
jgi:arsenate reductase-like glutaredoxin family protein